MRELASIVSEIRAELSATPALPRRTMYFILALLVAQMVSASVYLPYILLRWGWGYHL